MFWLLLTRPRDLGTPRVALSVLRVLLGRGDRPFVISRRPGPLLDDFSALAPTSLEPLYRVRRRLWRTRGLAWLALTVDTVAATISIARRRPHVVYLNSTASSAYLRPALWLRRSVILHSHESGDVAARFIGPLRARRLLSRVTLVACSPTVECALRSMAPSDGRSIVMIPSVPDDVAVLEGAKCRATLDLEPGEVVVGCCGTVEWRKGADLWKAVAARVLSQASERAVRFVWIGDIAQDSLVGGSGSEMFVGARSNPYAEMQRFDIVTLPSRDDPFPLVVLEAMLLGKPVVAFAVGGVPAQLGDAGIVVPALDVETFANEVLRLINDEGRRHTLGVRARERVERLYSFASFQQSLEVLLNQLMT